MTAFLERVDWSRVRREVEMTLRECESQSREVAVQARSRHRPTGREQEILDALRRTSVEANALLARIKDLP